MRVLAGDIGGTKTRLAIFRQDGDGVHAEVERTLQSGDFSGLWEVIQASGLLEGQGVDAACFGVAGPVRDNACRVTSLPWVVHGAQLTSSLGCEACIINDLEAVGWGLDLVPEEQRLCLHRGLVESVGNQSLVAPGTGLGEAFRLWDGHRYRTWGSEGSHADFGPEDQRECDLLAWLGDQLDHVSWERVVSGPGIRTLHSYLVEREHHPLSAELASKMEAGDPSAAIVDAARAGDPTCREAVNWFLGLLGAEAGNHALKIMSTGGVFLCGGIPPKLADLFEDSPFLARFLAKGRMRRIMEQMPVHLIMDDRVAVYGAAACAFQIVGTPK